ncbi:type IV pilus twitching motility protein PilT [Beijerinckia indica]|uniref:Type II secretion system protein E n=1 Tax=Beijerinckia indica subsp. indica (strain ATCC 9039 / DSM 1715 / NCIMB 8712) TaxID=395963 RepID=B2IL31_BEII9|nr:ATPase, T2SS/T4P/T4SS family [Beijerinckia indica]ACB97231.1 type II secretion system protein E [Beijerinckia indica subsp. indica ATCC 9039]
MNAPLSTVWQGRGADPWVRDPRKSAPGLDHLLTWAYRQGASRIAFLSGHPVWVRIHGLNQPVEPDPIPESDLALITNHIYGADGTARLKKGQDFDLTYEVLLDRGTRLRFRINATATRTSRRDGVNIILRPIPDKPPTLEQQRVEQGILESFRPHEGMVIVSGATGSGKSTLIAGMTMAKLNDPNGHYNIIEGAAPIEFMFDRMRSDSSTIVQSEIPIDLPTFEAFIRGCMRREPTDIIVGECRDSVTMAAAIQAAISGHTLTTTIHANDVALTMQRIASLCPPDERDNLISAVAQSLRLVINQKLIRSSDGKRIALREFLVFNRALRTTFLETDPKLWPALTRQAIATEGQSYEQAINRLLEAGLISEETAAHERKEIG